MSEADLLDDLTTWLEVERRIYAQAAVEAGIDPTVLISEHVIHSVTDTGSQSSIRKTAVSPMSFPYFAMEMKRHPTKCPEATACAARLYAEFGRRCQVWVPFSQIAFEAQAVEWIEGWLLSRVRAEYLANISTLERGDMDLARQMAKGLVALLQTDELSFVTWLPLAGFRIEAQPFQVENVMLRPLTNAELGEIHTRRDKMNRPQRRGTPFEMDVPSERCVLEVRTAFRKDPDVQPSPGNFARATVLALQLLGFEPHGQGLAATWTEPGPSLWNGGPKFRLPARGRSVDITQQDLERAVALARRVPEHVFLHPASREDIALHRFHLGAADGSSADALIDFAIALEALLLPSEFHGELSFRFCLNGALFLGRTRDDRHRIYGELRDVYAARSMLVHGKNGGDARKVREAAPVARRLAGAMLLLALEHGFPTQDALRDAALDAAPD